MMCCNFTDLNTILIIASKHIQSPLYRKMPQTFHDLVLSLMLRIQFDHQLLLDGSLHNP
jgi:hypothetical protein